MLKEVDIPIPKEISIKSHSNDWVRWYNFAGSSHLKPKEYKLMNPRADKTVHPLIYQWDIESLKSSIVNQLKRHEQDTIKD